MNSKVRNAYYFEYKITSQVIIGMADFQVLPPCTTGTSSGAYRMDSKTRICCAHTFISEYHVLYSLT